MGWALTNGPSVDDMASAIAVTGIAILLASQPLMQAATSGLIGIDIAVDGLVANTDQIGKLDGAQML